MNWETNEVPLNIGGYKYDQKTRTFPVFINYDKSEEISDTMKYEDHFTSNSSLIAISKSGRTVLSEIEWLLDVPVRQDIYEYIVNE